MARVPTYDAPTVAPTVGGQPAFRSVISEGAATLPGRQMQEAGLAIQKAGVATLDIATKAAMVANKLRLNDAYNRALDTSVELKSGKEGFNNLQGAAAVMGIDGKRMSDVYTQKLQEQISQIGEGLDNDALKAQWAQVSGQLAGRFHAEALAHEGEQTHIWANQVDNGTMMSSANAIASDPFNPATTAFHMDRVRTAASAVAERQGLTGEPKDLAVQAAMGKMHLQIIDGMMTTNPTGAKTYFEAHKTDFSALDAKAVGQKVDEASAGAEAITVVDKILAASVKDPNGAYPAETIDAAIREAAGGDKHKLDAYRSEAQHRRSTHDYQEREIEAASSLRIQDAIAAGMSINQIRAMPEWSGFKQKVSVISHFEAQADRSLARNDAYRRRQEDQGMMAYSVLTDPSNPRGIASMSETQIRALSLDLGPRVVARLIDAKRSFGTTTSIDDNEFKGLAVQAGLDPFKPKPNETDKTRMGVLRFNIDEALAAEAAVKGRKLTPAEASAVARNTVSVVARKPHGGWMGRDTIPIAALTPDDLKEISVPTPNRSALAAAMQKAYAKTGNRMYAPTEDNLKRFYAASKVAK